MSFEVSLSSTDTGYEKLKYLVYLKMSLNEGIPHSLKVC